LYLHRLKTVATKHGAAVSTVDEVKIFWDKARIPIRRIDHALEKLEGIVQQWEELKKNKSRRTATQITNEEAVQESFGDLFDIAHQDALAMIKIPEDKAFLLAQREKGSRGAMAGVDVSMMNKEKAQAKKRERQLEWKAKQDAEMHKLNDRVNLDSSFSASSTEESSDSEAKEAIGGTAPLAPKRQRSHILTPSVLSSLDRSKLSDRRAVQIIAPNIHATGQDIEDYKSTSSSVI